MARSTVAQHERDPQLDSATLGHLGILISSLPPHGRAFVRDAIGVTAAASFDGADRNLALKMLDASWVEIEAAAQAGDRERA